MRIQQRRLLRGLYQPPAQRHRGQSQSHARRRLSAGRLQRHRLGPRPRARPPPPPSPRNRPIRVRHPQTNSPPPDGRHNTPRGPAPPCPFTIEADSSVTAPFNLNPRPLTIAKDGSAAGPAEDQFNNGGSFGACTSPQPNGTVVKVKATPAAGSELVAISGTGSAPARGPAPPHPLPPATAQSGFGTLKPIPRPPTVATTRPGARPRPAPSRSKPTAR